VRKEKKDHGTSKLIEGDMSAGDNVLVVEDVITSAGSCVAAVKTLRENGAVVNEIISVIDREAGGREILSDIGITLTSLARSSELLEKQRGC
jgi:orotate phosphoribosyltransferase